jgi:uncharacterized protein YbjQ (UPF0145 family)
MLDLLILVALLGLGYGFGSMAERRHFKSIIEREERLRGILLIPEKRLPSEFANRFVDGNVVISVDFFKQFLAGLRALVGGRIRAYETLAERARREAILRMKEQAFRNGAMAVFNCKLETACISKGARGSIGSVEVYAYGTAIIPNKG